MLKTCYFAFLHKLTVSSFYIHIYNPFSVFLYEVEFVSFLPQRLLWKRVAFPHCPAVSTLS